MRPLLGEPARRSGVEQRRGRIGKAAVGIIGGRDPLRLDEDRPAGPRAAKGVVDAPATATSSAATALSRSGPRKPGRALQAAILVLDHAGGDQRRPGQVSANRVPFRRYSARFIMVQPPTSR